MRGPPKNPFWLAALFRLRWSGLRERGRGDISRKETLISDYARPGSFLDEKMLAPAISGVLVPRLRGGEFDGRCVESQLPFAVHIHHHALAVVNLALENQAS